MPFLPQALLCLLDPPCLTRPRCCLPLPQVYAQAYDNPIPGFKTPTVGNLRLWDALPVTEFDLAAFNAGDYDKVSGRPRPPTQAGHL